MAYSESKNSVLQQRRRVAVSSTSTPPGDPDLHHPLQYRKQEALWKRDLCRAHLKFCACPNFLDHFKWPSTGEGGGEDRDVRGGGVDVATYTGEDMDITGATGGGEGDITDQELLM
uniref:ORF2 n=1 Tax=Torque teno Leptonychotes weddellii virus-1 TaxID=2012676 RepID=A0A1Z2RVQ1_9VIRU|nr:ORF2 [Torque teno Leptonychotes weddellii virus 1]